MIYARGIAQSGFGSKEELQKLMHITIIININWSLIIVLYDLSLSRYYWCLGKILI